MTQTVSDCQLIQQQGGELTPQCRAALGLTSSSGGTGEGEGIGLPSGYNFNREKGAAFLQSNPLAFLIPGGGLMRLYAGYLQQKWQDEMDNTAAQTNVPAASTGGAAASTGGAAAPSLPSSNASRQSDMLSSAGESWGAPTVGSGGGNVSRGFSTGGW